jgi:hypothetical protein
MSVRIEKGYDFPYPNDDKLDGLTIERFNKLLKGFYNRRERFDGLIMTNISSNVEQLLTQSL